MGYPLYDPRVYSILAAFLRAWRRVGETGDVDVLTTWLREFGETHPGRLEALKRWGGGSRPCGNQTRQTGPRIDATSR